MDQFFVKNPVIKIRISEKVAEAIKPIYDENSDNDETLLLSYVTNQQNSRKANILDINNLLVLC